MAIAEVNKLRSNNYYYYIDFFADSQNFCHLQQCIRTDNVQYYNVASSFSK